MKSQLTQDIVTKGNTVATTTYDYNAETSAGSNTYTGAYQGGAVTHTHTYTTWPGDHSNADQRNTYVWWDTAVQSQTAELEQLAVNPRRTPQRILAAHAADEVDQFALDLGPATAPAAFAGLSTHLSDAMAQA